MVEFAITGSALGKARQMDKLCRVSFDKGAGAVSAFLAKLKPLVFERVLYVQYEGGWVESKYLYPSRKGVGFYCYYKVDDDYTLVGKTLDYTKVRDVYVSLFDFNSFQVTVFDSLDSKKRELMKGALARLISIPIFVKFLSVSVPQGFSVYTDYYEDGVKKIGFKLTIETPYLGDDEDYYYDVSIVIPVYVNRSFVNVYANRYDRYERRRRRGWERTKLDLGRKGIEVPHSEDFNAIAKAVSDSFEVVNSFIEGKVK